MDRVRLEIMPWLSHVLGAQDSHLVLEEEVEEGETVGELLARIAARHQRFGELVLDAETGRLTGHVSLTFNGRLLELLDGLQTKMRDGDTIVLLPAFAGG
jgi:molybdopterin synthase sulfur carrier subunit